MPPVRTLVNGSTPATATPATATPATTRPAQAGAVALPAWATQSPAIPDMPAGTGSPYIASTSPRSAKWPQQQAAGCADGDYYLESQRQFTRLGTFRFWVPLVSAFRTLMDAQGNVTSATKDLSDWSRDEHYVAIVIADVGGKLTVAKWDCRKTKSGSLTPVLGAIQHASTPGFAQLSDAHRVAAAFPVPFGRVVGTASVTRRVARGSGNVYYAGTATVAPTPLADLTRLQEALSDAEFVRALESIKVAYDERVKMLDAMCR